MKKLRLLIFFLLLSIPLIAHAWMSVLDLSGGVESGGSCSLEAEIGADEPQVGGTQVGKSYDNNYISGFFTAGDWGPISKIQLYLTQVGNVDGQTWTIQLYTTTPSTPATKVANGSCTFSGTDFGADGYFGCVLSTPVQLTNATVYHVGINRGGSNDSTNYFTYNCYNGGSNDLYRSSDESTWLATDYTATIRAKFYSGTCTGN